MRKKRKRTRPIKTHEKLATSYLCWHQYSNLHFNLTIITFSFPLHPLFIYSTPKPKPRPRTILVAILNWGTECRSHVVKVIDHEGRWKPWNLPISLDHILPSLSLCAQNKKSINLKACSLYNPNNLLTWQHVQTQNALLLNVNVDTWCQSRLWKTNSSTSSNPWLPVMVEAHRKIFGSNATWAWQMSKTSSQMTMIDGD